ncbi:MAG: hypothetical protein ACFFDN_05210 [Candidatus Hodarchaeota archaeon]
MIYNDENKDLIRSLLNDHESIRYKDAFIKKLIETFNTTEILIAILILENKIDVNKIMNFISKVKNDLRNDYKIE